MQPRQSLSPALRSNQQQAAVPSHQPCSTPTWKKTSPATTSASASRDRGVQYVSIEYTERLAEAGIEPSVGSVGDSYDNALAETINGLCKTEVIRRSRSISSSSARRSR